MHGFISNSRNWFGSGLPFAFLALIVSAMAVAPQIRAQEKGSGSASCAPSDLSSSIAQQGHIVQVTPAAEESGRKENARLSGTMASSDVAASPADIEQRKEAYKIFLKEARRGNPAAMVNTGVASLAGWGTESNAGAALYWLHAAADSGYGPALYNLGILFFKGCSVPKDAAEAFHFFDLGARAGYGSAEVNLGYLYDHGLGVGQDHAAAASWYRRAAESGVVQAQYNLGDMYLHGDGAPKDEPAAFVWFQKAALQGHTGAQIMAGSMLAAGRGTSKDLVGAYFWVFKAVLQGDDRGAVTLRALERQLTSEQIEQAKAHAKSFSGAHEAGSSVVLLH